MKFFVIRKYLFILFVSFACANVNAQSEETMVDTLKQEAYYEEDNGQDVEEDNNIYLNLIDLNLTNQIPLATFSKNLSSASFGISLSYYNNFSKKDDFLWGIHFSSFKIARLSNNFRVQETFAEYDLFSKTKTNLIFLGYALRYFPDFYTPSLEPFLDVKLGVNYIYTYTADTIDGAEDAEVSFNNSDFSLGYSIGMGVQYNVRQGQALHLIANYHGGTSATYYINGEKGFEDPFDNFVRRTTQLDYLQFAFGLTFGF